MKNRIFKLCMLLTVLSVLVVDSADAQTKKPQRNNSKRTAKKVTNRNKAATAKVEAPAKDTVPAVVIPEPDLKMDTVKPSLRTDYAFEHNLIKDRIPLP